MKDSGEESDIVLLKLLLLLRIHIDRRLGCMGEEDLSLLNGMPVVGPAAVLEHNKSPSISLSYRLAVDVAFGLLIIVDIFDGDDVVLLNNDRIRFICLCLGAWMRLAWSWLITKGSPGCRGPKR